mmetsp:Transcript_38720/g.60998  ORF Transcript_38720/g.60998 Transcript_38720/m.60998 type:complete len:234 (+) Transcript_38720:157-858(+)
MQGTLCEQHPSDLGRHAGSHDVLAAEPLAGEPLKTTKRSPTGTKPHRRRCDRQFGNGRRRCRQRRGLEFHACDGNRFHDLEFEARFNVAGRGGGSNQHGIRTGGAVHVAGDDAGWDSRSPHARLHDERRLSDLQLSGGDFHCELSGSVQWQQPVAGAKDVGVEDHVDVDGALHTHGAAGHDRFTHHARQCGARFRPGEEAGLRHGAHGGHHRWSDAGHGLDCHAAGSLQRCWG